MLKNNKTVIIFLFVIIAVVIYALSGDRPADDSDVTQPGLSIQSWSGKQGNKVF